jgi:hypothetical protein
MKSKVSVTCNICFEKVKKLVSCPFCDSKSCIDCAQDYFLNTPIPDAHCMGCKKKWSVKFFADTFPLSFRRGPFLEKKKNVLLEEQTAILPSTLPVLEAKRKERKLKKEGEEMKKILKAKRDEILSLEEQIRANQEIIKNGVALSRKKYISKCPKEIKDEMCRGFIEEDSHSCTLCKTKICNKCHVILPETFVPKARRDFETPLQSKAFHACKKEDVETVEMIMKDTRPCPSCSTRIHKVVGCDQMFCTQCHTAFSWNNGTIETGTIHNPHYYELMKKLGNDRRTAGDVPCGGLVDARLLLGNHVPPENEQEILNIHRRCAEITTYILNRNRENVNYEDIRILYLKNKINEEKFKEAIYARSCMIEKRREELQILSTFQTSVIERLNKLVEDSNEVYSRKVLRKDYEDEDAGTEDEDTDYENKTVVVLKSILKKRNLSLVGLKKDLIARLIRSDNGEEVEEAKVPKRRTYKRGKVRASSKKSTKSTVKSVYMSLPIQEKQKLLKELFLEVSKEVKKIVKFCNEAFEESFTYMGYDIFPVINLKEEYNYLA